MLTMIISIIGFTCVICAATCGIVSACWKRYDDQEKIGSMYEDKKHY